MSTLQVLLPPLSRFESLPEVAHRLARADALPDGASGELAASDSFHWPGADLPVAALMREQSVGDAGDAVWLSADPAHVKPDMTGARMLACGSLDITADEAEALSAPLRPLFGDSGMRLETTSPSRWHVRLTANSPLPPFSHPGDVLGDDLANHLPEGDDGRRWRQLFNEVQILLHQNPVNRQREQRGQIPVNALWFWGGGRLPAWIKSDVRQVYADDRLPRVLARQAGIGAQALQAFDAGERLASDTLLDLGRSGSPQACSDMVFGMLQKRRVDALILHFAGGERWRMTRGQRWRFWRRAQ